MVANIGKKSSAVNAKAARAHDMTIWGLHAVAAAMANEDRVIRRIMLTRNAARRIGLDPQALPAMAELVAPAAIAAVLPGEAVHQGVCAFVAPLPEIALTSILDRREGVVLVLDGVTDPHNIGAIFRSAAGFGVDAVIMSRRRAPVLSGVVAKAASGAVEKVREVRVVNIARALNDMNDAGWRTIGLGSEFAVELSEAVEQGERMALVLGAEGSGLRPLVAASCSVLARIAMPGGGSLNVSNAAAIALYAATRRKQASETPEGARSNP